ncbi:hypothetical protein OCAR_5554 [Afipia carboxidovorans OM5]|uniref:Uncharacterized protein n=1 Tax=Afipia carboxidovorans (strain ATCC 49405 / DSM 1227 / KCTC 32145 / OM5) TaxID=504832 RepID=B6JE96_AFIC5|nr:hypothetical protein [Afipia carboxidovorans]ACI92685.1 hypothetical protein OCAR_5554 [Afipia carboxidovorans OM5]AEI03561.1 hypothetical protein OCA4_c24410 [Afipia carboxidovorans OM4]AEI07138.1 hypothetical protein OCA5_c24420 [Afipia carboxidovorans OM5]BEV44719.1 hypothetical protein CRBSH125_09020 [Afipia carboxidovorans]
MASEAKPSNGYDIKKIDGYLDRMQNIEDECASIMGKAMQECKSLREDQKEIKEEAKNAGIRSKVFNELWKARKAVLKSESSLSDLDGDDREQIEEILRHANDDKSFGDTPFGAHLLSVFS